MKKEAVGFNNQVIKKTAVSIMKPKILKSDTCFIIQSSIGVFKHYHQK